MFLVGLTGGIATGKSTVSQMFKDLGCPIVDADLIAREVVEPSTRGWKKIKETFGEEVFQFDGRLDRAKLGDIVFVDEKKRQALNKITHPEIYKTMLWRLVSLLIRGEQFAILDLPLLFESKKMVPYMSFIVVVSCSDDQQLSRLQKRNKLTVQEAEQRINSQMLLAEKCAGATHIIDNSGDLEHTKEQVLEVYRTLVKCKRHWTLRIAMCSVVAAVTSTIVYFVR